MKNKMSAAKKLTPKKMVKKYQDGGPKSRMEKLSKKKDTLETQVREDAPMGMGDAWVKMTPEINRMEKKIEKLKKKATPKAKKGGMMKSYKKGGTIKTAKKTVKK